MKNKVLIITNESIFKNNENHFCDNLDIKSIPEELSKNFEITLIGRSSKKERYHKIQNSKIYAESNIFSFIKKINLILKQNICNKFLIISITPYTFLACVLFFFNNKKPFVYLRSDGFEEYKSIFGFLGPFIYNFMFIITSKISNFISCREHILKKNKGKIVSPSQLTDKWFKYTKPVSINKANLLYVGRIKVEKGIFSLLKIFKNINRNVTLTIVSSKKMHDKIKPLKNIKLLDSQNDDDLINIYDQSNIFILPSFTEGHPQVLDEALARLRPVIVFKEIEHVKRSRPGVFVCERSIFSLEKQIDFILKNFKNIQNEIEKNTDKLPTRKSFIKELENLLI